jgi:hypothetical protein
MKYRIWPLILAGVLTACQPGGAPVGKPAGVWEGDQPPYPMTDATGAPRLVNGQPVRIAGSHFAFDLGADGWIACDQAQTDGRRYALTGQFTHTTDEQGRWVVQTALDDGYSSGLRFFTLTLDAAEGTGMCTPPPPEPAFEVRLRKPQ